MSVAAIIAGLASAGFVGALWLALKLLGERDFERSKRTESECGAERLRGHRDYWKGAAESVQAELAQAQAAKHATERAFDEAAESLELERMKRADADGLAEHRLDLIRERDDQIEALRTDVRTLEQQRDQALAQRQDADNAQEWLQGAADEIERLRLELQAAHASIEEIANERDTERQLRQDADRALDEAAEERDQARNEHDTERWQARNMDRAREKVEASYQDAAQQLWEERQARIKAEAERDGVSYKDKRSEQGLGERQPGTEVEREADRARSAERRLNAMRQGYDRELQARQEAENDRDEAMAQLAVARRERDEYQRERDNERAIRLDMVSELSAESEKREEAERQRDGLRAQLRREREAGQQRQPDTVFTPSRCGSCGRVACYSGCRWGAPIAGMGVMPCSGADTTDANGAGHDAVEGDQ